MNRILLPAAGNQVTFPVLRPACEQALELTVEDAASRVQRSAERGFFIEVMSDILRSCPTDVLAGVLAGQLDGEPLMGTESKRHTNA